MGPQVLAAVAMASGVALAGQTEGARKLIEFGWDEPDTAFMRAHIGEMEQTPFDGCVFHLLYPKEDGSKGNFTWECWSTRAFRREELWPAVADLRAIRGSRFTENFLRFNVTPGDVDWFDDFAPILGNARLAAEIARAGGCPGILFDIEQYNARLFHYPSQAHKDTQSFGEYAAQVRRRGAELMRAFQEPYAGVTIFLTFGYCLPWYQAGSAEKLPEASYGLLAALLDGMLEAAGPSATFVDGHEASYPYKEREQFERARQAMAEDVLPIVADREAYREHFSFGFGVWMDCDWRNTGWAEGPFTGNHFLPMDLYRSLRVALELCDDYVWVYTEQPRWWSEEGPQKLPRAYARAVEEARRDAARP